MSSAAQSGWIVAQAKQLGFDLCGVVPITSEGAGTDGQLPSLAEWLARGYAGEMRYLHDPRRAHPQLAVPEARSLIVCALNYNTAQLHSTYAAAQAAGSKTATGWISRYAWGDDYHEVVRDKLEALTATLKQHFGPDLVARAYADTGPVSERAAARAAGLGWIGKNTCLINESAGSWLFLGVILTSLEILPAGVAPLTPAPDLCGNCRLCLDACPTGALVESYVLDARRCISYLTIELRGEIPEELRAPIGWQVFGCDICQDVCPWNRAAPATPAAEFQPRENLFSPELAWLLALTEGDFPAAFRRSAVKRTKWRGLVRNACVAAGNAAPNLDPDERARLRASLERLASSDETVIASHARWALNHFP